MFKKISQKPYNVNMLIAGYDDDVESEAGPSLFFMDYLSAMVKVPFGIHGYGSYFGLSVCDKYYKRDMNETEAFFLLNKIVAEVSPTCLWFNLT
jgi:20S proteasome subunit beta 4